MPDDINYIKVTQLASSDSATTVGAIFPDSQYLDIYGTDSDQVTILSSDNEHIPTSKMVKESCVSKAGDTLEEISSPKVFTGAVGNSQSQPGIYLGLDENDQQPNANISIISNNTAAYIDFSRPNVDYDFRIIKWTDLNNSLAQLCYSGNVGNYILNIPAKNGTLATTDEIPTKTSDLNNDSEFITSHQSIKSLDTTQTTAQSTSSSETIVGSGTIKLHKIAKTGNYSDLIGSPAISGSAIIATDSSNIVTLKTGIIQTGGAISNSSGTDIVLAKVAKTGNYSDLTGSPSNVVNSIGSVSGAITISNNFQMSGQQLQVKSLPCYTSTSGTSGSVSNKNIIVLTESQASGITYNSDYIYFITEN